LLTLTRISVEPRGAGSIETRGSGQLTMLLPNRDETFLAQPRCDAGARGKSGGWVARLGVLEISEYLSAGVTQGYGAGRGNGNASRVFAGSSTWSE
jgi:hypothetical protein